MPGGFFHGLAYVQRLADGMGELGDDLLLGVANYLPRGSRLFLAGRSLAGAQALRYIIILSSRAAAAHAYTINLPWGNPLNSVADDSWNKSIFHTYQRTKP
jgi:hypothetical protein